MKYRLIILDFDGTLADTRPLIVHTMQRTLRELSYGVRSEGECAAVIGLPLRECFVRLLSIDEASAERCAEVYRRFFDEDNHAGAVLLYPHVRRVLQWLKGRGVRLAVCSSRGRPTLTAYVPALGLDGLFDCIVGAEDVVRAKPHPEPVEKILHQLGERAEDTLVVGDASFDILMGRGAGCATCGVSYGNQPAEELMAAGADFVIDSFDELIGICQQ